jgi:hypothetical protein
LGISAEGNISEIAGMSSGKKMQMFWHLLGLDAKFML